MEKPQAEASTLKNLIADVGTTQKQVSIKTGLSERTLNDWVAGKKIPRLDNALLLCRELGVSLKTLAASLGLDTAGIPDDRPPE
jgi:transcriptional regulator with XRE-family HTH domain